NQDERAEAVFPPKRQAHQHASGRRRVTGFALRKTACGFRGLFYVKLPMRFGCFEKRLGKRRKTLGSGPKRLAYERKILGCGRKDLAWGRNALGEGDKGLVIEVNCRV